MLQLYHNVSHLPIRFFQITIDQQGIARSSIATIPYYISLIVYLQDRAKLYKLYKYMYMHETRSLQYITY